MKQKTHIFQNILRSGQAIGHQPGRLKASRDWFRNVAREITIGNPKLFLKSERDFKYFKRDEIRPGYLYMFVYDAKWKDKLPYWDAFPLVFPWRTVTGKDGKPGFIGINLHYLPPGPRAALMDQLYTVASNDKFNDNTKLNISYDILRKVADDDKLNPCIHMYLNGHVRTKLYKIPSEHWDTALFLPVEDFQKASKEQVWRKTW